MRKEDFICAGWGRGSFVKPVAAPWFRKEFQAPGAMEEELSGCGNHWREGAVSCPVSPRARRAGIPDDHTSGRPFLWKLGSQGSFYVMGEFYLG